MSDVVVLIIIAVWALMFAGYVVLLDRVGR